MYVCTCVHSQAVLSAAGKDGKTTVFLLTDTQIKEEGFLEDVDGLLNAGEVPNLFELDEKQDLLEVSVCAYAHTYHCTLMHVHMYVHVCRL